MEIVQDICITSAEILMMIFGMIGVAVSLLLVLSPESVKAAGDWLDTKVNLDKKITYYLNQYIPTGRFAYRHNIFFGLALITGSLVVLIFLFFQLDIMGYNNVLDEVIINSLALVGKIAGFAGIILGLFLLFVPEKMKTIENKMNTWFDTQPLVDKLNKSYRDVDSIFFRHPIVFGIAGMTSSIILIALSMKALLR